MRRCDGGIPNAESKPVQGDAANPGEGGDSGQLHLATAHIIPQGRIGDACGLGCVGDADALGGLTQALAALAEEGELVIHEGALSGA